MSRCRCGLEKVTTYDALQRPQPRPRCVRCDRVAPPRKLHPDEATPSRALVLRSAPTVPEFTHRRAAVIQFSSPTMPARPAAPSLEVSGRPRVGAMRPCLTCGAPTEVRKGYQAKRCRNCPPFALEAL